MYADKNRVLGCMLGGVNGDVFGAPIEAIFSLKGITKKHGSRGLREFAYHKSPWDDAEREGVGVLTDDSTQKACTLAAIIDTASLRGDEFYNASLDRMWQYYMLWGREQKYGDVIAKAAGIDIKAPDYLRPFLFRCGAGLNTLGGLSVGYRGTRERPLEYDLKIDGRDIKSPNKGCGSIMRVAPLAFVMDKVDLCAYAGDMAHITHGDADAVAATSVAALLVANALHAPDLKTALMQTKSDLSKVPHNDAVADAWHIAEAAYAENGADMHIIDALGRMNKDNPFLAVPMFRQTVYGVYAAADKDAEPEAFKDVIRLSANHSGDSDSVASVVGDVVGASWGYNALPRDWMEKIPQRDDMLALCSHYLKAARRENNTP